MPVSLGGADAGGEPEAAQMSPTKHVVGHPAGVGVVLLDGKACLMVQQAVQDARRLAGRGGDHLGVERTVLVGDMGIERHAGLVDRKKHTSERQSLMRISYAVFCLKRKRSRKSQKMQYRSGYIHHRMSNTSRTTYRYSCTHGVEHHY